MDLDLDVKSPSANFDGVDSINIDDDTSRAYAPADADPAHDDTNESSADTGGDSSTHQPPRKRKKRSAISHRHSGGRKRKSTNTNTSSQQQQQQQPNDADAGTIVSPVPNNNIASSIKAKIKTISKPKVFNLQRKITSLEGTIDKQNEQIKTYIKHIKYLSTRS